MFESVYPQIGIAITALVVGFAFFKGGEPERVAASAFVLVVLAGLMVPEVLTGEGPKWSWFAFDLLLLAVFVGLYFHSHRTWTVWAASFQGLIVTGHALVLLNINPPANALASVNNLANLGVLAALAGGTFWAWQERQASMMR